MEALRASSMLPGFQLSSTSNAQAGRMCLPCKCSSSPKGMHGSSLRSVPKSTKRSAKVAASASEQPKGYNIEDTVALPTNFCLIEHRDTVQDFAEMDLAEITKNVEVRRNKIFLLMEEVRRLKIQQRFKQGELGELEEEDLEEQYRGEYNSAIPLLPPMTDETINTYYTFYTLSVAAIILFGGIVAPILEVQIGLGGQSYAEFIEFLHLPKQLSQVDPFVASFTGGAVGVVSSLMVVEVNNVKNQAKSRCQYCKGTGYLGCGSCSGKGIITSASSKPCRCTLCSGTGKVMCTTCLCTGMAMATEHDPRIDPFD